MRTRTERAAATAPTVNRWNRTANLFDDAEYLYRREYWVFRKLPRWLTKDEALKLTATVCNIFGVYAPKVRVTQRKELGKGIIGSYSPEEGIWLAAAKTAQPRRSHRAVNNQCDKLWIHYYNVPQGTVSACTLLHELAHHLSCEWFGNGRHDAVFAAVNEVLHEWYSRSRPKYGVKRRMRVDRKETW